MNRLMLALHHISPGLLRANWVASGVQGGVRARRMKSEGQMGSMQLAFHTRFVIFRFRIAMQILCRCPDR